MNWPFGSLPAARLRAATKLPKRLLTAPRELDALKRKFAAFDPATGEIALIKEQIEALRGGVADGHAILTQVEQILAFNKIAPPPPAHLQRRVVGAVSPNFIASATRTIAGFAGALASNGARLEDMSSILDFGVGCGRVSRRIAETFPNAELVGADIDGEAIDWLNANYAPRLGAFVTLPHMPPSSLPSDKFDFVYSISVFTHLDEEMQFAWLDELRRVTKPGGLLILTIHGDNYIQLFPPEIRDKILKDGIYYNKDAGLTEGLPDFYKNTYHTREYIMRNWSKYFDILTYLPLGCEEHQDLIVCRKPA
jgi:SAM-dependent methyltransferase